MNQTQQHTTNHHHGNGEKVTKSGTIAERIVWMSRTSDELGSHIKTDLESYLTLIRRKIQEKCATTAELIAQIRRFKIGESVHVTPNEFRFTLIKFGVILPQILVDRIFNVFDSDRSGTMDFDEFATWIMNSEFRPAVKKSRFQLDEHERPEKILQKKMKQCLDNYPSVFKQLKEQVSFLEFISEVNRVAMPLTEREARNIFQLLDPKDEGFIESASLVLWATTGRFERHNLRLQREEEALRSLDIRTADELKNLIKRIIGNNTRQLENAFSHIKIGQGTKLPFEEFRRCLLNGGIGKNLYDIKQLFLALGGKKEGLADIDAFFANLAPVPSDPFNEVSAKRAPTAIISTSRADRHLRDALRKCFKEIKHEIEIEDRDSSGYVSSESLYRILVKRCMPLSFEDFRFVIQQIRHEPGTTRIDYNHFFHAYNPLLPHHELNGLATLKNYSDRTLLSLPSPTTHLNSPKNHLKQLGSSGGNLSFSASAPAFRLQDLKITSNNNSEKSRNENTVAGAQDDSLIGIQNRNTPLDSSLDGTNNSNPELKKIWQAVLRECHRVDPERTGQVNRVAFIAALEKADNGRALTPEGMNKLADQYTLSNGLVNYLMLFRSYLGTDHRRSSTAAPGMSRIRSLPALGDSTRESTAALNNTYTLPAGPVHPWEFGYTREKHQEFPYWHKATSLPKSTTASLKVSVSSIPSATEKSADQLTDQEKTALLSQYNNMVLQVCHKCYELFLPLWRALRGDLKKNQVTNQKGTILTNHFISILEKHGIILSKTELGLIVRSFRGYGTQDLVRFDDFLRVCMLVKNHFK